MKKLTEDQEHLLREWMSTGKTGQMDLTAGRKKKDKPETALLVLIALALALIALWITLNK